MRKSWLMGVACVGVLSAQAALTVAENNGEFSILRDGKVIVSKIEEVIGAPCDIKRSVETLADGTKVWNRWCETKDRRFRLEIGQRADGAIEISIAGQAEADSRVRNRSIRLSVPHDVLDGKNYDCLRRKDWYVPEKGTFATDMAKTQCHWLAVDGLLIDMYPTGVNSGNSGSTFSLCYPWDITREADAYHFTGSRTVWPPEGSFIGARMVIREGKFSDFDKYHFFRWYSYKAPFDAKNRLALGAPKVGDGFVDGNLAFDAKRGYGWVGDVQGTVKTGYKEGRLYSQVAGNTPATYRLGGLYDGWYIVNVDCGNRPGTKNAFSITANGETFAKNLQVAKNDVRFLSRVVHVKGGACDLAFTGNWIVSSISLQPLLSEGENFTIGRGYWLADGFEPTDIYKNEDFATMPVATLRDETAALPEPGRETAATPKEVPMPVERPDDNAPELAWLKNARMYRLNVSPMMARPENRKSTLAFLDGELNGKGYPAVMLTMNGVLFQRHSAPQYLDEGVETIRYFVNEMHRRGIKVIDHHDATMCENNHSGYRVYMERLPEALRSNVDNLPSHHYCLNNPAFKKTYMAYLRRLVEAGVDGFQIDELEFWKHGCTCVHCRRAFARDVGWQRPLNECDSSLRDVNSRFRQRWDDWRRKTVTNWFVEFRRFVKDLNPNLVLSIYCTNSGMFNSCPKSGRTTDLLDQRRVMNLFGTEVLDPNALRQARAVLPYFRMKNILVAEGGAPVWDWFYTRDWQAEYGGWSMSQLTGQTPILFNTVGASAPKFREWGASKSAMVREGAKEVARVAILYSENSRDWNRGNDFVAEMFGIAQALEQMHVPYVFVTDALVEKGWLGKFKFLFTGSSECLSDREIQLIRDFAAQGGAVYVSGMTGTADVFGNSRVRWAFQDVFGRKPSASAEPGAPQEVSYRKGRFIYSPGCRAKPFEMRECEWPHGKCPFKYDAAAEDAYQTELAGFLRGSTIWSCKAPKKVYTSLWREQDGRIAIHFFNATGVPDPVYKQCFACESPTNSYPRAEKDIHFAVPGSGLVSAIAESPDFAGAITLSLHRLKDGRVAVTLPKDRLTTYTLVRLTYAKGEDDVLTGTDQWGCRKSHPAVVNAVTDDPKDPNRLSLRGRWLFMYTPEKNGRRNSHDNPFFGDMRKWDYCTALQVPGCWEASGVVGLPGMAECWEFKSDNSAKPIRNKAMGEAWYRKKFDVPANWAGKRIWLKIGGVKSCGWFWINKGQVAHVYNYCGTVKYDVTDLVRTGEENEIIAQVSNDFPSRKGLLSNTHRWGGLYRDVELEATPDNLIDDAWVRGNFDAQTAEVHVTVAAGGCMPATELKVRAEIEETVVEASVSFVPGETTTDVVLTVPLGKFRPWTPEKPELYLAKIALVEDGVETMTRRERFGVRKLEVRGKEFYLNNRPYFLRGFGDDHVYPLTGLTPADRKQHLKHLMTAHEAGFNFTRLHTHCEVPEYFEAADEAGILIQAELPYINGDIATENFQFDPVADTRELYANYRRYPSFAVYSGGNEGSFGKALDRRLYRFVKEMDPDRLKIVQDTQMEKFNTAENSDYGGGPVMEWPRGSIEPGRPFVCHEYLNLTVKLDPSYSSDFSGAWLPPVLPEKRYGQFSSWFGLDREWADRLQFAQHRLQSYWIKHGVEAARLDPHCDGFCLWTIVDVVVKQGDDYSSQGLFDPFWRPKRGGLTAREAGVFNAPVAVLLDDPEGGWVYRSGETLNLDFYLSQYGETALKDAKLTWRFLDGARELSAGTQNLGDQPIGPVRKVGSRVGLVVPDVTRPLKAHLEAKVGAAKNGWDFWFFPKREKKALSGVLVAQDLVERMTKLYTGVRETSDKSADVSTVVVSRDDPLLDSALARGRDVIVIGPVDRALVKPDRPWFPGWDYGRVIPEEKTRGYKAASRDIKLGWWYIGHQVGTALAKSPILKELPHEGYLSPLLFRIIGKGEELTADLRPNEARVIVGEGREKCYSYLTTWQSGRSRIVEINGLDVLSGYPEGTAVLDGVFAWLNAGRE